MKKILIWALAVLMASPVITAQEHKCKKNQKVKPGIEVLRDGGFAAVKGKKIGLLTNPTGVDSELNSTIDILHNAPDVKLVALYAPEHGVRGDIYAGATVKDAKDSATGIPV